MPTHLINGYLSANLDGKKTISHQIIEKNIRDGFYHILVYLTVNAPAGSVITTSPDIYMKADLINKTTNELRQIDVEASAYPLETVTLRIIATDLNGAVINSVGNINSYTSYPVYRLSGFLFFKIPLSNDILGNIVLVPRH